jgi:hypothetical protein
VPGGGVDETFAGRPAYQRAIFDAIMRHLDTLGEVHLDAVSVGVFLKRERKMAEIRPKARSLRMWLVLGHRSLDPRVQRADATPGGRVAHVFKLTSAEDVDEGLRELLTEAFLLAGD